MQLLSAGAAPASTGSPPATWTKRALVRRMAAAVLPAARLRRERLAALLSRAPPLPSDTPSPDEANRTPAPGGPMINVVATLAFAFLLGVLGCLVEIYGTSRRQRRQPNHAQRPAPYRHPALSAYHSRVPSHRTSRRGEATLPGSWPPAKLRDLSKNRFWSAKELRAYLNSRNPECRPPESAESDSSCLTALDAALSTIALEGRKEGPAADSSPVSTADAHDQSASILRAS
jgi:hypothetical protein